MPEKDEIVFYVLSKENVVSRLYMDNVFMFDLKITPIYMIYVPTRTVCEWKRQIPILGL